MLTFVWAGRICLTAVAQVRFRQYYFASVILRFGLLILAFAGWTFFQGIPLQRGQVAICVVYGIADHASWGGKAIRRSHAGPAH